MAYEKVCQHDFIARNIIFEEKSGFKKETNIEFSVFEPPVWKIPLLLLKIL